jgi:NitT/TauT family transport system substrate-binding protein
MRRFTAVRKVGTVAVTAALAVALTACGSKSDNSGSTAATKVRIAISTGAAGYLPAVLVEQGKIMSDQGVNVETIALNNTTAISAVTAGSVDVIGQGPDLVATANSQGEDLRFFCRAITANWVNMVAMSASTLPAGGDYKTVMKALSGKNVGVPALGSTTELQLQELAKQAGVDYKSITVIPVGTGAAAQTALTSGQIDALVTVPFVPQQLTTSGQGKVLIDFGAIPQVTNPMTYAWAAKKTWLDANPQLAQNLCKAFQAAIPYARDSANRSTVDKVMSSQYGITDAKTIDAILAPKGILDIFGTSLTCDDINGAVKNYVDRGSIKGTAPTCDQLMWTPPAS